MSNVAIISCFADIDECAEDKNKCNTVFENCVNTLGDYFCARKLCRIGYQMNDKGICEGQGYILFILEIFPESDS